MTVVQILTNLYKKKIHTLKVFAPNIGQCPRMIPVCPGVTLSIYNCPGSIVLENGIYNRPGYIYIYIYIYTRK